MSLLYRITCPHCKRSHDHDFAANGTSTAECLICRKPFKSKVPNAKYCKSKECRRMLNSIRCQKYYYECRALKEKDGA